MKTINLLILLLLGFSACKQPQKQKVVQPKKAQPEKRYFSDLKPQVTKYKDLRNEYTKNDDNKNAKKYNDSIKQLIVGSYLKPHQFKTMDGGVYDTSQNDNPLFLITAASWCANCMAEIPALNKIADKYSDKVDVVVLIWDKKAGAKKFASKYDKKIALVPSTEEHQGGEIIEISGFKLLITAFPIYYLITPKRKVIGYGGSVITPLLIGKEEADKQNYKSLKTAIEKLLKKS